MTTPAQTPDVDPKLGDPSRGSGSGMDRFRSFINRLSDGGIPAIQEHLQRDFAKKAAEGKMYQDAWKQASGILTQAQQTRSKDAPYGVNPANGKPFTQEEIDAIKHQYDAAYAAYSKLLPKEGKGVAQKLHGLLGHLTGHGVPAPPGAAAGGGGGDKAAAGGGGAATGAAPAKAASTPAAGVGGAGGQAAPPVPPPPGATGEQEAQQLSDVTRMAEERRPLDLKREEEVETKRAEAGIEGEAPKRMYDTLSGLKNEQGQPVFTPDEVKKVVEGKFGGAAMRHAPRILWASREDGTRYPLTYDANDGTYRDAQGNVVENPTLIPEGLMPQVSGSTSDYDAETGRTTTHRTVQRVPLGGGGGRGGRGTTPVPPPPGGGGAPRATTPAPGGRVASMAEDWQRNGVVPAAKDRPAVEKYMHDRGMQPGVKPTATEIKLRDDIKRGEMALNDLESFISDNRLQDAGRGGMFSPSAWYERGKVERAWKEYTSGLPPKDPKLAKLIKFAAGIKIMGASAWVSIGRGKFIYSEIVQHLPSPTDTPAQLWDKALYFRDILEYGKASLPESLTGAGAPGVPKNPYE